MSRRLRPVETISVHVPFAIRKYGDRKQLITPNGEAAAIENGPASTAPSSRRWLALSLEENAGKRAVHHLTELAEHEKLALTYITRVLRLSLLPPEIAEMILDGRQPPEMMLARLMERFPVGWSVQQTNHWYEPTGPYHRDFEVALEADFPLVKVNPLQARCFAQPHGTKAKTDAVDARMLAMMGDAFSLPPQPQTPSNQPDLKELHVARLALVKDRTRTLNLQKTCHWPFSNTKPKPG